MRAALIPVWEDRPFPASHLDPGSSKRDPSFRLTIARTWATAPDFSFAWRSGHPGSSPYKQSHAPSTITFDTQYSGSSSIRLKLTLAECSKGEMAKPIP